MAANEEKVSKLVEWLGDTGASRHVCNDLSLMRDIRTREKPTTPAREEAETVDTAEEFSTRISTKITKITIISNFRDQNSEGKIPELQIQNATTLGGLDTTRISAAFV